MSVITTTEFATPNYVLAAGDSIVPAGNLSIGIDASSTGGMVQIAGSVFGLYAIYLGGDSTGLMIGPSGQLMGRTQGALVVAGANANIANLGSILGGVNGVELNSTGIRLQNGGQISARDYGIAINGTATIVNAGQVSGGLGAIVGKEADITNSGWIIADTAAEMAIDMATSVAANVVLNSGRIVGQVRTGGGADLFDGETGTVTGDVRLGSGNDTAVGGTGTDRLFGDDNDDLLQGNAGDDRLEGGAGVDTLVGGTGDDTYVVDLADDLAEFAGGGRDTVVVNASFRLEEFFENLTAAGSAAIALAGNADRNVLRGNGASNVMNGDAGIDTMIGGGGDDTYVVESAYERTIEKAGEGTDTVISSLSWSLADNLETLRLAGTAVTGIGNGLANTVVGNAAGNVLQGLDGNDTLAGAAGNDLLSGGLGADQLSGGSGLDAFLFDTTPGTPGNADVIADFVAADDTIRIDDAAYTGLSGPGPLAAAAFRAGSGVTSAGDATDRIAYDTATGRLFYDADGAGGAASVLIATLSGKPVLTAADILVV